MVGKRSTLLNVEKIEAIFILLLFSLGVTGIPVVTDCSIAATCLAVFSF